MSLNKFIVFNNMTKHYTYYHNNTYYHNYKIFPRNIYCVLFNSRHTIFYYFFHFFFLLVRYTSPQSIFIFK